MQQFFNVYSNILLILLFQIIKLHILTLSFDYDGENSEFIDFGKISFY